MKWLCLVAVWMTASLCWAAAPLELMTPLSDHMVLQRERPIILRGRAAGGAEVMAEIAQQTVRTRAEAGGAFELTLPALSPGGPHELVLRSGEARLAIGDIMVGDVWLLAGQSNMAYRLEAQPNVKALVAKVKETPPLLRFMTTRQRFGREPQQRLDPQQAGWQRCSAETVESMSGVGYYFATQLERELGEGVPVGIIIAARAGTFIEAWIPEGDLRGQGGFEPIFQQWEWLDANKAALQATQARELEAWKAQHGTRFGQWRASGADGPFLPHQPGAIPASDSVHYPGVLYNAMIHPHTALPIKGVVWYQGESNTDRAYQYRDLLKQMISSYRTAWGDEALPFIVAQLPNYDYRQNPYDHQDGGPWEVLRESQQVACTAGGAQLVTTLGLGLRRDVHPPSKAELGRRLANSALERVYGKPVAATAPSLARQEVQEGRILLTFDGCYEGLQNLRGGEVGGFEIAGADRVFHPAKTVLLARDVVAVSSAEVAAPVAVRHAWSGDPAWCLANSAGLPLSSFRTDDWPVLSQGRTMPYWWVRPDAETAP